MDGGGSQRDTMMKLFFHMMGCQEVQPTGGGLEDGNNLQLLLLEVMEIKHLANVKLLDVLDEIYVEMNVNMIQSLCWSSALRSGH